MRVIRHAEVLLNGTFLKRDVLFDEKILAIEDVIEGDYEEIDGTGKKLIPGLIDVHVHLREPGFEKKETIRTGTAAAAHGGFTTVFAMPNLNPVPDCDEHVLPYLKKIKSDALVHVYPYGSITIGEKGTSRTDYESLKKLGIRWFSDDGVGVKDETIMREALTDAKNAGVMLVCHTEDMNYRIKGASVHESAYAEKKGWITIPSACEYAQLKRDLKLAKEIGAAYHACHISAKESVQAIREAKNNGADVSAEVTVHHLLLEDKDVKGPNWKMNPPLRSHEDRLALIEGLENGTLDLIANDHAPHTKQDKEKPMAEAAFGIVSLETALALLYTEFVHEEKRWTLAQLVHWMSEMPAKRFGLQHKGKIEVGYDADLVLVETEKESVIDASAFESKGKNTPFDGWSVQLRVTETIVSGKTVRKEEK